MKTHFVPFAPALTALALVVAAPEARAQSAGAPQTAATGALEEVVVTSEKQSENLQKTPVAVTAETGETLTTQGITDVRGLGSLVPALELGQDYIYTQVDIRGVGANNDAPALDPAIAFNIDGIYQPRDYGTYGSFFDIDRVEVLRGPQGTLYGRNATGGSINVITNKPSLDDFSGAAEIELGNYGLVRSFAMLNVPVDSDFAIRGAFQSETHDGYLTSGFNDQDSYAGRLQALYKPSAEFSLLVGGDYFDDDAIGAHTVIGLPFIDPGNPWFDPTSTEGSYSRFRAGSVHGQLDWTFGDGITLTELAGFKQVDINSNDPVVGVFSKAIITDKSFSSETRLSSPQLAGLPINWVAGLYGFNETDYSYSNYYNPYFSSITTNPDINETSGAVFGQGTYTVAEGIRLVAGLRYSIDSKHANGEDDVFVPFLPFPVAKIPDNFDATYYHLDWKVGAEADISPDQMVYANIATGYLEGGFNLGSGVGLLPNFQPEKLTAYTVGSKNEFLDHKIRLNVEAFYYDYRDYIVSEYLTQGPAAGDFALYNAAKSEIYGAEFETQFVLSPEDRLDFNLSLLHAQYTDFTLPVPSNGTTDLSGFQAMKSPYLDIQAGYQHRWDLGDAGVIEGAVQTHFETGYWTLFDHTAGTRQPAYTKTNLVLTYLTANGRWHVQAYVDNVENSAVLATEAPPNSSSNGAPWAHLEPPRTFGARVGVNF
ncbi:MAG TPA: TonB-dependent receptor [Stellaceae bacterium]|nr:TonB-dependent receptor [Stellaceae bacterium]